MKINRRLGASYMRACDVYIFIFINTRTPYALLFRESLGAMHIYILYTRETRININTLTDGNAIEHLVEPKIDRSVLSVEFYIV